MEQETKERSQKHLAQEDLNPLKQPWMVWLSWLEHHPSGWRVMGSIPGQARTSRQQCFSLTLMLRSLFFKKDFIYLFLERAEGRETERERNINVWLPLSSFLWGPGPQPRHVRSLGIELATLWFTGWHQFTEPHQPGKTWKTS